MTEVIEVKRAALVHGDALKRTRAGLTLFEISISMLIALFAVGSALMLFPVGIKAEQTARMRVYAGVKAEEMLEEFSNTSSTSPCIETEAPDSWDAPSGYRVMTPDLESRICAPRFGIMPVPMAIARRLDSDNDEIKGILDQGGYLYYSQAQETSGLEDSIEAQHNTVATDNETQKLVFAVNGYAQNNNVAYLAWKDWPYYEPFPSPPGHGEKEGYGAWFPGGAVLADHLPNDAVNFIYAGGAYNASINLWEGVGAGGPDSGSMNGQGGTIDGDIRTVFTVGFQPYAFAGINQPATPSYDQAAGAQTYLQSALWYCVKKGVPPAIYAPGTGFSIPAQVATAMATFNNTGTLPENEKWSWVQALRFLSSASTCMTRWYTLTQLGGQLPSTSSGVSIPAATIGPDGSSSPTIVLTHDLIVYYHELSMSMVMLYCASQPYDWGVPRPLQRAIMTDYPLIEYDLLSPTLTGVISGTSVQAQQWRPLPAHPIANIGRSYSFPDTPIDPTGTRFSSTQGNFTLARPFQAAERCRELVFWSVDWQSYADAETAPSAPVDASKYLFGAPMNDSNGAPLTMQQRMSTCQWPNHHIFAFRNPEKIITFTDPAVLTWPNGADVSNIRILSGDGEGNDKYDGSTNSICKFLGLWGADRNFNGKLDIGPVPTSVRLRAQLVSRYEFYDPRLTLKMK